MSEITENTAVTAEKEYFESNLTGQQVEDALTAIVNGKIDEAIELGVASAANAKTAKSWAVGGTGTRDNEEITNAKYYAEMAAGGSIAEGAITVGSLTVGNRGYQEDNQNTMTVGKNNIAIGEGAFARGVMSIAAKGYAYTVRDITFLASSQKYNVRVYAGSTSITSAMLEDAIVVLTPLDAGKSPVVVLNAEYSSSAAVNIPKASWPENVSPNTIFSTLVIISKPNDAASSIAKAPHAEGYASVACGDYAFAMGDRCVASGSGSHAEGENCNAKGMQCHAEGSRCSAAGYRCHAEGVNTNTAGGIFGAHAEGWGTTANSDYQHVSGKYNTASTNKAVIVGNGTSSARSNAYTLDWSGNGWFAGKVTVGAAANVADPTADNELVPKAYLDKVVGALEARIAALEGNE